MPLMSLDTKTRSFVWTDVNELSTLAAYKKVMALCWGWGELKYDPVKFYQEIHGNKVFTVRQWVYLGGSGPARQEIRVDIKGVYAEGCQYLMKEDPIFFLGMLRYDPKYSQLKNFPFFLVEAQMVIPPYSADGREFCARKNAIIERQNAEMIRRYTDMETGEFLPGMEKLEEHLKGERDGSL